jgi:hypothetical protein
MPEPAVQLSGNWREAVDAAWHCRLTPELASAMEGVCNYIVACRRYIGVSRKEIDDGKKRHEVIARLAKELIAALKADMFGGRSYRLQAKTYPQMLLGGAERELELLISLAELKEVSERPVPDYLLSFAGTGKRGRPKSDDGWSQLISWMIDIYTRAKGEAPTIWVNKKTRRYDSAFMVGLRVLHDALPDDVRLISAKDVLGSRAYEMLNPERKKRKKCRT